MPELKSDTLTGFAGEHIAAEWKNGEITELPVPDEDRDILLHSGTSILLLHINVRKKTARKMERPVGKMEFVKLDFNSSLTEIHQQKFLSPRPEGYSIGQRKNGRYAWEWNHYGHNALHVDDSLLRQAEGTFTTPSGIPFKTPETGANTVAVSIWDNFPTSMEIPLKGKAKRVHLLFCCTTNAMQTDVVNARITLKTSGEDAKMDLIQPKNFDDFLIATYQKELESVYLSDSTHALHAVIDVPENRELSALHIEGIANEVILMLLGITLER